MIPITPFLSLLSPKAERARLLVLLFHRVQLTKDTLFPGEVDARQFDNILGWIERWCNVLPLHQAVTQLMCNNAPARATAIRFSAAVSTAVGAADRHADPLQLPRFTPWDRTRTRFGLRLAANLMAKRQTVQ